MQYERGYTLRERVCCRSEGEYCTSEGEYCMSEGEYCMSENQRMSMRTDLDLELECSVGREGLLTC